MITYSENKSPILVTTTPRVEFDSNVPVSFINSFLRYMGKGYIKVKDYQGNELKVYYESN
jgi:hypothetical protein